MTLANDHILVTAASWQANGHAVAVAVVVRTWGSSPRQNGSLMAIRDDGQIAGSVSGGCVESAVIESGLRLISDGGAERLDFGVADETAWRAGLSCGGQIGVWVCAQSSMDEGLLGVAADRIKTRRTVTIACDLARGRMSMAKDGVDFGGGDSRDANSLANSFNEESGVFRLEIKAKPRVLIIGGVHISQHLAPMAMETGFDVTIIDPRETFANAERFPGSHSGSRSGSHSGIELISDWPQDTMAAMPLDSETALVTLTHDPKIDDAALKAGLHHPLFYIACLGSRRTHAARLERLREAGFDEDQLNRIKGPAGLNIGAETPAEIAVSVLAELVAAWRGIGPGVGPGREPGKTA